MLPLLLRHCHLDVSVEGAVLDAHPARRGRVEEGEAEITHRQGLQSAACTRGRTAARIRLATSVRVTQERSCQAAWVPPRNGQIRCDTTIRHSADDTSIRWL